METGFFLHLSTESQHFYLISLLKCQFSQITEL
jgi:hypothetical protein